MLLNDKAHINSKRIVYILNCMCLFLLLTSVSMCINFKGQEISTSKTACADNTEKIATIKNRDTQTKVEDVTNKTLECEVTEPTEVTTTISETKYYDVPLSYEEQDIVIGICEQYGVDYTLVLAIMQAESNFQCGLISPTNDYGIMQINKCNHKWLKSQLGIEDMLSLYDNTLAGVYLISHNLNTYNGNVNMALMAYNLGDKGAKHKWNNGIYSNRYSRNIIQIQNNLKKV